MYFKLIFYVLNLLYIHRGKKTPPLSFRIAKDEKFYFQHYYGLNIILKFYNIGEFYQLMKYDNCI